MLFLKQSTSYTAKIGPFLDDTDGKTAEGGLTLSQGDIRLSKNGGNIAQKNESTACTHDELGYYDCPLDDTDTGTLGKLQLFVHESGALPVFHEFMVLPANVYDSLFSTDKLQVHVDEMTAGIITATAIADAAIDFATFAADCITGTGLKANVESISAGAITATAIAANAIDADSLAADAGTEIGTAVWATATRTLTALDEDSTTIDLDGAIAAAVPTAAAIADAVWDEASTGHVDAGKAGAQLWTDIDAVITTLGTPAGASIAADLVVIDNFVDGLETTIGAAGAGLTAVPWNAAWDAEVQSEVDDALKALSLADATSFTANTLPDIIRKILYALVSKMEIKSAGASQGDFTVYKIDGTTPAGTGSVTDDGVDTTTRTAITWA